MTKFWVYVLFASCALMLAFTSSNQHGSRDWIVGIWSLFGCFPWWLLLPLISSDPNGQITLGHVTAMTILNALLLYAMCRSKIQKVGLLQYIGFQLGRCASRLRKWN
jgi:hypothetical protein